MLQVIIKKIKLKPKFTSIYRESSLNFMFSGKDIRFVVCKVCTGEYVGPGTVCLSVGEDIIVKTKELCNSEYSQKGVLQFHQVP